MTDMNAVTSWDDVPIFDGEEAESSFWSENRVDIRLMENSVVHSSEGAESVTITLRIDPRMLARIKRVARERFLNYQSMIKQWLAERLEKEFRDRPT
jgi:predicted DNA binding CopG/RHH family protein